MPSCRPTQTVAIPFAVGQIDEDCRATTVAHSPSRAPIAAVLRFKKQGRSHAHNNTATFRKSSSQSTKMP
jgi:hypothetical protein